MDGQILAQSLVTLKGTELRMVYALFLKTNIGHLLSSKTKDVLSRLSKEESDNFTYHLEQEVKKLNNVEDHVLQVDLFLEITKLLKLRGTKYTLAKEMEDQCYVITREVYQQLLKQDKEFKVFVDKELHSSELQQMVKYQMSKVFNELDYSIHDFDTKDQMKFASQVNDYLQSLPEEQQAKIKEKLGIDDLTDEMVSKAIATSGTSIVFAIIVEISGFAFYTTATSIIASFSGFFGITLPFGVYTGLTSTIAVLANPLFIAPILLGGGALLFNHQNKSLKRKLLPIIVMQITLPFMSQRGDEVSFEFFKAEWNQRFQKYNKLHAELEIADVAEQKLKGNISKTYEQISNLQSQINNVEQQIGEEKQQIYFALKTINLEELEINDAFRKNREEYKSIKNRLHNLQHGKKVNCVNDGIFKKIGNTFSNFASSLDIKEEEKKVAVCLNKMVQDVLDSTSSFKQKEREKIEAGMMQLIELRQSKDEKMNYKNSLVSALGQVNQDQRRLKQEIKTMAKQNYGLEHINTSSQELQLVSEKR
ncbi:hypothetical protein [Oceanobacillus manasiensis]|uniref:hypothetical protein n=1 Tax=Oceanobacillus manasiensis TaxID=586413 RepID=UPI0005A9AB48|nr:hypothetical protein [Oceanobacillus manasiensis]